MASQAHVIEARGEAHRAGHAVIDVDIHPMATAEQLAPYLSQRWRDYQPYGHRQLSTQLDLVRAREWAARSDTYPPRGGPPGSDPTFIAEQLLDRYDLSWAVANPVNAGAAGTGPLAFTQAHCRATNQWVADEFLAKDPRWLASLSVAYEFGGDTVVQEIEHWAREPRFRQVVLAIRTEKPLGDPKYWPMYEACEAHGLAIAIHPGTSGNAVTGAGWPSYYFEDHVDFPQAVPTHVASMICEGVFDRFPSLQLVIVEGGWSYAAWLAGRLDASWRVLRDEVRELDRLPSEYLRERVWYTTQPMEEPENPAWFAELLERTGVEDRLMYSSDYPHWDFDSPHDSMPKGLSPDTQRKLFHGNACKLYGVTVEGAA